VRYRRSATDSSIILTIVEHQWCHIQPFGTKVQFFGLGIATFEGFVNNGDHDTGFGDSNACSDRAKAIPFSDKA
jgi:hypothetical protein